MKQIKLIIWDLDETLADTRHIKIHRDNRKWTTALELARNVKAFPEIADIFNKLSKFIKQCIVTNSPRQYAQSVIKSINITEDLLIAYHDMAKRKPDPEPFLRAMKYFDANTLETVAIEDSLKDIQCARNSKCVFIGVTWGECSYSTFKALGAKYVVSDSKELLATLIQIDRNANCLD